MRNIIDEWMDERFSQRYYNEKKQLDENVEKLKNKMFEEYKRRYPFRLVSQFYIKSFINKLLQMKLLPNKEEYIYLNKNNEFFDITISVLIEKQSIPMEFIFPYPVNIHKVTEYISKNRIMPVTLNVIDLKRIINPECFDEFDDHMYRKNKGLDPLDSMKADNPIIVLNSGEIVNSFWLINGTHRTIQAIRDKKDTIEGYRVTSEICQMCGMTEDYEVLYGMMKDLDTKLKKLKIF